MQRNVREWTYVMLMRTPHLQLRGFGPPGVNSGLIMIYWIYCRCGDSESSFLHGVDLLLIIFYSITLVFCDFVLNGSSCIQRIVKSVVSPCSNLQLPQSTNWLTTNWKNGMWLSKAVQISRREDVYIPPRPSKWCWELLHLDKMAEAQKITMHLNTLQTSKIKN